MIAAVIESKLNSFLNPIADDPSSLESKDWERA